MVTQSWLLAACFLWLTVVEGRPDPHHRHTQVVRNERADPKGAAEFQADGERRPTETQGSPRASRDSGTDAQSESESESERAWKRFFNDFMNHQKTFRGRTRKRSSSNCFGVKMDRIGAMSSLGC